MSEIAFTKEHVVASDADIIFFWASRDGKKIKCKISMEELGREFLSGRVVPPDQFEEEFLRLRPQIEARAKEMILGKE